MGHVEIYLFRFAVDNLQAFKVDNIGSTILKWLQKESKNTQWVRAVCCLGCMILV